MTSAASQCDDDWREIEQFVAEITALTRSCQSLETFSSELLRRGVEVLNASGGKIWLTSKGNDLQPVSSIDCESHQWLAEPNHRSKHQRFLETVLESGQPRTSALQSAGTTPTAVRPIIHHAAEPQSGSNACYWVAAPFEADHGTRGVIEVIQDASVSAAGLSGCERLLSMMGDLTAEFLRRRQLDELRSTTKQWQQYESLSQRAHASLDLRDTCFQLVNDGRLFVGCDRVSLVVAVNGNLKTLAISGVDTFERRANLVRSMERLANAVADSGQWIRYRGSTDELPPQIEQPIGEFADESHSQTIDVVPLLASETASGTESEKLVGVLLLERFDAANQDGIEGRIVQLATLGSAAIRNAIDYQTLPLLSLSRAARDVLQTGNRQRRWLVIAGSILLASVLAFCLIPATFQVEAEGTAQPLIRRNLYAPLDGEVVRIGGNHDERIDKDQVLVVLRSRELEIELQRLQGEYQTTEKKLLAVASARVQRDRENDVDRFPGQLAAEEQELKQQLVSLQRQLELIRKQRDQLTLRSPIPGRIMTWDPQELLADRPVQRGQLLVSVADVAGPWILELTVTERRAGHLISAAQDLDEPLDVSFTSATGDAPTYHGTLKQISGRTEVIDNEQTATRLRVDIPHEAIQWLRPGTAIHAKIDCGKRSLGFVWLHDIYETLRSWVLF